MAALGFFLAPLGAFFATVTRLRRMAYRRRWLTSVRPPLPTLSIGNIAAGGTGKTPLLFSAIDWLERHGGEVGVLSRGYGGDEGRMLEERFPATLLVEGANRVQGLKTMMAGNPPELLLLDDGFQHFPLQRDFDVVVLDATQPWGRCFPAGLFREPPSALRRADCIILSRADLVSSQEREQIWKKVDQVRKGLPTMPRVEGGVVAQVVRNLKSGEERPLSFFKQKTLCLAAGIGNPASFQALCEQAGLTPTSYRWKPDHYAWTSEDVLDFSKEKLVLVTEKDGVKIRPFATENIWEVRVDWKFQKGQDVWEDTLHALHLPVRAARIEPLWSAHDPHGRTVGR
ncbi:MAG: tetraacyldisaccharide 4'-kinase [Planctomycetota bacterium]|nr:tetraacyldisaccharide 4'-kinase [Planctomycetota bacterium]